jgi:hypothetical protein
MVLVVARIVGWADTSCVRIRRIGGNRVDDAAGRPDAAASPNHY